MNELSLQIKRNTTSADLTVTVLQLSYFSNNRLIILEIQGGYRTQASLYISVCIPANPIIVFTRLRVLNNVTPHAQRERGKVIGFGVHIYICLGMKKIFESYFRDRLTFSNICSRTSHRIYRLALPLRAPEMLSSLSKSRISIFNAHLTVG